MVLQIGKLDSDVLRGGLAEFLATTLFVFIGTGSVVSTGEFLAQNDDQGVVARLMPISMAFGMAIMVLVYAFGHISGGHINPAVTVMLVLVQACDVVRGCVYILCQLAGAILGSLILWGCTSDFSNTLGNLTEAEEELISGTQLEARSTVPPFNLGNNGLNPLLNTGNGFFYEFMGTLLLCLTVAFTAVHKGSMAQGQPSTAPIAIGFAVFLAHIVLVPATGCGINPARTFGPAVVNSFAGQNVWTKTWFYYVGPLVASFVSAGIYGALGDDCCEEEQQKAQTEEGNGASSSGPATEDSAPSKA